MIRKINNEIKVKANKELPNKKNYDFNINDKFFEITINSKAQTIPEIKTTADFMKLLTERYIRIHPKSTFLLSVIQDLAINNWVDVEVKYFLMLKKFKPKDINKGISLFKAALIDYINNEIQAKPRECDSKISEHFKTIGLNNETCILNFNYTEFPESYKSNFDHDKLQVINIHGTLKDVNNPIIFGYGDEMDKNVEEFENTYDDAYLINLKTMSYHLTPNYQNLIGFLHGGYFNVHIMGHSCGISDRLLFNTIFEYPKEYCKSIKIYYHQEKNKDTNEITDDFYRKCVQLYRHFSPGNKRKARELIVDYTSSCPLLNISC